jgi:hypothetical protein
VLDRLAATTYLGLMATDLRPGHTPSARSPRGSEPRSRRPATAIPIDVGQALPSSARPIDLNRVGVVFVHGIGTQPACKTFLDWSCPIVELLSDWRAGHGFGEDPVLRCDYDLSGQRLPFLELDVPAYDGYAAQSWVMTEAWWAATTLSPGLGSMTAYVSRALPGIMGGIRRSYRLRSDGWATQRTDARKVASESNGYEHSELVLDAVPARRRDWIDLLDRIQKELTILAFGPALILGRLALFAYAPFRAIPIKPLQDFAALKTADNFLTRWFGELPDIIDDPIQAANVRSRLVGAIRGLRAEGCGRIVVVAHSGGAIVSFTTLCDPVFTDERVDKLITLGEGLSLAWRIENASKGLPAGSRLLGDLKAARPKLRWADFWATYDPAPAGPIDPPPGVRLADRSYSTTNRMSILEDHGSYWDNDEEFLIPLLQHIDTPTGDPEESRFFRDASLGTVRLAWRRRRVAVLALWRWVATLGAGIPIALTSVTALLGIAGRPGPERLGADAAGWWGTVPGHEVIAGPLDGLSRMTNWPGLLLPLGEWGLGAAIVAVAFLVLARFGVRRWATWDRRERLTARERVPAKASSLRPMLTFGALTVVAVVMSVATAAYMWR